MSLFHEREIVSTYSSSKYKHSSSKYKSASSLAVQRKTEGNVISALLRYFLCADGELPPYLHKTKQLTGNSFVNSSSPMHFWASAAANYMLYNERLTYSQNDRGGPNTRKGNDCDPIGVAEAP